MNRFIVTDVIVDGPRISYKYTVEGEWQNCFCLDEEFFIEYGEDISDTPLSIAVIPLLCNVLPVAWVCDAEIIVRDIDHDFYESIDKFKQGYIDMYPAMNFKGRVIAKSITSNNAIATDKAIAFYSGGVDAFSTLISHLDEKPVLMTLWGADIAFEDEEGWERVRKQTDITARTYGLDKIFVKSGFRRFLNESELNNRVRISNDNWWHGFQHGIGLIGQSAPYAWKKRVKTIYIASTFSQWDKEIYTCASDPSIDDHVKFCGTCTIHDGFAFTRQDKVRRICEYAVKSGNSIELRVCWQTAGGENCGKCEKCIRTILAILAEGYDPKMFGFGKYDLKQASYLIRHRFLMDSSIMSFYKQIKDSFVGNLGIIGIDPQMRWIQTYNFNHTNRDPQKILRRLYSKCPRIVHRIVRTIIPKRV